MKRHAAWLLLIGWLLPGLACNIPRAADPGVDSLVQATLAAQRIQTLQAGENPSEATPPVAPTQLLATHAALDVFPTSLPPAEGQPAVFRYITRPGDTRPALALRFGTSLDDILNPQENDPLAMLPPGLELQVPNNFATLETTPLLLPDSEVIYSHAAAGFSTDQYVESAAGFLSSYTEIIDGEKLNGAQIVERAAIETSISPRLLLAFLDYRSGWVRSSPPGASQTTHPIGFFAGGYSGLYKELILTARQLTIGYYGWRSGKTTELLFPNGESRRMDPQINPGSAALQTLFSKLYSPPLLREELYQPGRFLQFYVAMFGDPWERAEAAGPLLPYGLSQPPLELPFLPGETWTLTGGPHAAWGIGSAWGGIDFAPADVEPGCTVTRYWATSAAAGQVIRSERGVVSIDLDGDGYESTGWVLVYLHIADEGRVSPGTQVSLDDRIGHPSCEGGVATGTHIHFARKYNGEWIAAGQPLPLILSGWLAWEGSKPYSGTLTRGDWVVTARPDGARTSLLTR